MHPKDKLLQSLKNKLVVSCQALPDEPLYGSILMRTMAEAAMRGGASGIRANSVDDITEIMGHVPLPVIGIIKKIVPGSQVYITPTRSEVDALAKIGVPIIAMDATSRERPDKIPLSDSFPAIRKTYPDILFMADCATYEDGLRARELGFDIVGTTLCGYTEETKGTELPHYELIEKLVKNLSVPVAAEGGIWTPEHMKKAFHAGAHFCVVGTAITRPMHITRRFVEELP